MLLSTLPYLNKESESSKSERKMKIKEPLEYQYSINIVIIRTIMNQNKVLCHWQKILRSDLQSMAGKKLLEPVRDFFSLSLTCTISVLCVVLHPCLYEFRKFHNECYDYLKNVHLNYIYTHHWHSNFLLNSYFLWIETSPPWEEKLGQLVWFAQSAQ